MKKKINEMTLHVNEEEAWYNDLCLDVLNEVQKYLWENLEPLFVAGGVESLRKIDPKTEGIFIARIGLEDGSIEVNVNSGVSFNNDDGNYYHIGGFVERAVDLVDKEENKHLDNEVILDNVGGFTINSLNLSDYIKSEVRKILNDIIKTR